MKRWIVLCLLFKSIMGISCILEKQVTGEELQSFLDLSNVYVENNNGKFLNAKNKKIDSETNYLIQYGMRKYDKDYNSRYLDYYSYEQLVQYLEKSKIDLGLNGYFISKVGKSIEGKDLYRVAPKSFDSQKKIIVILARQHGDEGSANWILEGFINQLKMNLQPGLDEFQFIIYPMVNPDGVANQSRYNANDRDLNRSWHKDIAQNYDEAKFIHQDLRALIGSKKPLLVLDMHGSYYKDFVFRVKPSYISKEYYQKQQEFIDSMGQYDSWQGGKNKRSNGSRKMIRIVLGREHGINALTHETPRDIKRNNSENRSLATLKEQGQSLLHSIVKLY